MVSATFLMGDNVGWGPYGFRAQLDHDIARHVAGPTGDVSGISVCVRFCVRQKTAKMTYKSRAPLAWSSQDLKNPVNRRERVWRIRSDRVIKSDCA